MATLNEFQEELCRQSTWDFSDLSALFLNCSLKKSSEVSHTQGLMDISMEIMRRQGVRVEAIRAADYDIAPGVWPDMTEYGWEQDDWPQLFPRVMSANFMTWNILHLARMISDGGGWPVHGNQRSLWDAGCRFDYPNPEHR